MKSVVKKSILSVKPYAPGKPIDEVKRELGLNEVIKLASNENPYPPSPKVLKAISKAAKEVNRYPDGDCFYLREALANRLKVNPRQLIFANGSDELILMSVRTFVKKGDEVIIAKPSFLMYEIAATIEGANIKSIPIKDFRYDLNAMKRSVTKKTKIIFLGNPDNPSGTYLTKKDIEKFLKGLRSDILVFFDEAYFEYVNAKDYVDSIGLLKKHKNVIVTRTFSKMYGLAGLRIGYGIANLELVDILNRVREPFNVNSIAQAAALACLNEKAYYQNIAEKVKVQREFLYQNLDKLGVQYKESCTNFILVDVKSDATKVTQKMLKQGVIVRNMSGWGVKNFIRVSIGTQSENKKFIKVLGEAL